MQGELNTGYGRKQPYAPGFKIIEQEDGKVAQLYHEGTDGKSYTLVYINLDLNVRNAYKKWDHVGGNDRHSSLDAKKLFDFAKES